MNEVQLPDACTLAINVAKWPKQRYDVVQVLERERQHVDAQVGLIRLQFFVEDEFGQRQPLPHFWDGEIDVDEFLQRRGNLWTGAVYCLPDRTRFLESLGKRGDSGKVSSVLDLLKQLEDPAKRADFGVHSAILDQIVKKCGDWLASYGSTSDQEQFKESIKELWGRARIRQAYLAQLTAPDDQEDKRVLRLSPREQGCKNRHPIERADPFHRGWQIRGDSEGRRSVWPGLLARFMKEKKLGPDFLSHSQHFGPFFNWLEKLDWHQEFCCQSGSKESNRASDRVRKLSADEAKQYLVRKGGLRGVGDQEHSFPMIGVGKPFSTRPFCTENLGEESGIFVLHRRKGERKTLLSVGPHIIGSLHHSSFLPEGHELVSAGELHVSWSGSDKQSRLEELLLCSGHFKPGIETIPTMLSHCYKLGLVMTDDLPIRAYEPGAKISCKIEQGDQNFRAIEIKPLFVARYKLSDFQTREPGVFELPEANKGVITQNNLKEAVVKEIRNLQESGKLVKMGLNMNLARVQVPIVSPEVKPLPARPLEVADNERGDCYILVRDCLRSEIPISMIPFVGKISSDNHEISQVIGYEEEGGKAALSLDAVEVDEEGVMSY